VPVREPVSEDQPAKPAATIDRIGKKTARILLVEDDPHILELISMVLAEHGYQVGMADDGEKALQMYRSGGYDLVLMDIQMPGTNGLESTRLIRSEESQREHIAIIGFTAQVDRKTLENCTEAGMDCVLRKPFQLDELYRTIEHYLALTPPCRENNARSQKRRRR